MTVDIHAINGTDPTSMYDSVPWFADLLACRRCGCRDEAMRVVPGVGPRDAEIMVIGQNPGSEEDEAGVPFVGRGGDEFAVWLNRLGLDRRKILVTNIVKCHTYNNRRPRAREINVCQETWLKRELGTFVNVKILIALGRPALEGLVGKVEGIPDVMTPWWMKVDFGDRPFTLLPLPHPAYLLRVPAQKTLMYERVLPWVRAYLEREVPDEYSRARA